MIDILNRVRNKELQAKIVTAEEAAAFIKPGMNVGTSGFTPSGYPKAVPMALAARMEKEHFQINLWTGASTGDDVYGALAGDNGFKFRTERLIIAICICPSLLSWLVTASLVAKLM